MRRLFCVFAIDLKSRVIYNIIMNETGGIYVHILSGSDFVAVFGRKHSVHCFAPGRVNLIGDHTDYNGGRVFPCAINLGIECMAAPRSDGRFGFYSANFPSAGVSERSANEPVRGGDWSDYPMAVIMTFSRFGYAPKSGADFLFKGNLPDGAGPSSSAALEVLTGKILCELWKLPVTSQQNAVFGQFAENRFIGVNCGIMDQFASAMGRSGHALLLDTYTLDVEYSPVDTGRASVVIVNSGVKHSLASSAYNTRRRECETALANICLHKRIPSLCSISDDEFKELEGFIEDESCRRRALHAVSENSRTIAAAENLRSGDIEKFGRLMNESHVSLRDNYEVSCAELDFLAERAWGMPFVFGARMTGGGFGGCTVNLVKRGSEGEFAESISSSYRERFGFDCAVYNVSPGDGAGVVR